MPSRIIPLPKVGDQFGRLTATGRLKRINGRIHAECACLCGFALRFYKINNLSHGYTKSCGCLQTTLRWKHGNTQGDHQTPEYKSWACMKTRCLNSKTKAYPNYGGRGIKVCDRWADSFPSFLADMGPRPGPDYSLDRYPDNNGDYTPGNVRWATRNEQRRNSRQNIFLTINGETRCLTDWANIAGVAGPTLSGRVKRNWPVSELLSPPGIRRSPRRA